MMNNLQSTILVSVALIIWSAILGINIARTAPNDGSNKTIAIQGEGKSSAVPNIYTFNVMANEKGATTKEVNEALAKKTTAIQQILSEHNIDKKDIQSQNLDIFENRVYESSSSRIDGYRGNHSIQITIRNIDEAGKIIDHLTSIDGLLVNGGQYINDDKTDTLEQAREEAFENAQQKAQKLAELAGMKLGKVVSINESVSGWSYYSPIAYARNMDVSMEGASTEINPGEQEFSVQLNVVWEMK